MSASHGTPQGYHFPPPEPQPAYGYSNPQLLGGPQHGEPPAYELNYQAYSDSDPGPFQQGAHAQHQGYADADAEYGDEYYEDEEPRRGPRWMLIAVALVGAIGVGGALAYTYRSLVAPTTRVPVVKADPNVKVRPEQRGGREFPGAEARVPVRVADEAAPSAPQEEPSSDSPGPRAVKTIPITPGSASAAAPAAPAIPGITLYQPPERPAPPAAPSRQAAPPDQERAVEEPPKRVQPPPSGRVAIGTPPPPAAEEENDPPAASAPPVRQPPVRSAAVAPKPPPARPRQRPESSGLGYVAVLSSQKTSLKALEIFADLQQKYGDVLGNKSPDVQEADLSARGLGTMYRLVVGPPGSPNAARGVCKELRSAGYEGCWVKEY